MCRGRSGRVAAVAALLMVALGVVAHAGPRSSVPKVPWYRAWLAKAAHHRAAIAPLLPGTGIALERAAHDREALAPFFLGNAPWPRLARRIFKWNLLQTGVAGAVLAYGAATGDPLATDLGRFYLWNGAVQTGLSFPFAAKEYLETVHFESPPQGP